MQQFVIIFRQGHRELTETDLKDRAAETRIWAQGQNAAGHKLDPRILATERYVVQVDDSSTLTTATDAKPITALLFLAALILIRRWKLLSPILLFATAPMSRFARGLRPQCRHSDESFWLQGASWQLPTFENADIFVARLVREGLLVREPVVEAALQNQWADVTLRSVQRRFLRATGLTHGAVEQIVRARHATRLLQQGVSILDTVELAGYYDQPHLTKALKRLIGQTPAQLLAQENTMPLSFLSKTE